MLGILIGIAAVMLTVGLGQGAQEQVASEINALGSNLLIVTPGSTTPSSGFRGGRGSATTLTMADAAMLANPTIAPDVAAVAPASTSTRRWPRDRTTGPPPSSAPPRLAPRAGPHGDGGPFLHRGRAGHRQHGSRPRRDDARASCSPGQPDRADGDHQRATVHRDRRPRHRRARPSTNQDDQAVVPMTTFATARLAASGTERLDDLPAGRPARTPCPPPTRRSTPRCSPRTGSPRTSPDFTISSQQSLVETATSTEHILTVLLGGIAASRCWSAGSGS